MNQTIEAVFEAGVFRPCKPLSMPDGEHVTLTFYSPSIPAWPALPAELIKDSDGLVVARGTRITLSLMIRRLFQGISWTEMAEDFPTVTPTDWPAISRFVEFNRDPLRLVWEQDEREIEELRKSSPPGLSLSALRERFEHKFGKPFPRADAQVSH